MLRTHLGSLARRRGKQLVLDSPPDPVLLEGDYYEIH